MPGVTEPCRECRCCSLNSADCTRCGGAGAIDGQEWDDPAVMDCPDCDGIGEEWWCEDCSSQPGHDWNAPVQVVSS